MVSLDIEVLRQDLHRTIDETIDSYLEKNETAYDAFIITPREDIGQYSYSWPKEVEEFFSARWYDFSGKGVRKEGLRFLVAKATRPIWGKIRGHIAIFVSTQKADEKRAPYPCAEFIQTDVEDEYAAVIPNPSDPRKVLKDGDTLPTPFLNAKVKRTDQLFQSVQNGPSLRLVVNKDDVRAMIEHGYWVARCRGRLN